MKWILRHWNDLLFITALCTITGWWMATQKPDIIILHTDTAAMHAPMTEEEATTPGNLPGGP